MKIINVCPRFFPDIGGIETNVHEISKRLAKKHDVYVYTTTSSKKFKKEETIDNIKVRRFKGFAPNEGYFFSSGLYLALRKEGCDIMHLHSSHALPAYLAYLAFRNKNLKRIIFTPHYHPKASTAFRGFLHKIYDPIQSQIFDKADKIICDSNHEISLINKKFKTPKTKMINIPNGIDIKRLKIGYEKHKKDRKPDQFRILYVGRLEKYKRVQWIIHSLSRLLDNYPKRKITLTIIGNGPYEDVLRKKVEKFGLNKKIIFKKNLTDHELIKEYKNCDVFVMPSEYEAFSIVTLEALSCGKPVIVSNVGFLRELSRNNGYTIDSEEDLIKSLSKIIENGFEVDFDYRKYSWDKIADQVLKVYGE